MSIEFIPANPSSSKELTFGDVEDNQFFVNRHGSLCQKFNHETYHEIANSYGDPMCDQYNGVSSDQDIQRIIPTIDKIKF